MSPDCGMTRLGDLIKFKVHSFSAAESCFPTPKRRKIGGSPPLSGLASSNVYSFSTIERSQETEMSLDCRTVLLVWPQKKSILKATNFNRVDAIAS
jgi:hypothetical protein